MRDTAAGGGADPAGPRLESRMIGRLTGRLAAKAPDQVLLDVGGVGYLVHIPLSTFYELPEQESPASLWIHTHVREDALALYGFLTERERSLFLLLLGVTGIGPRVALTVLSGIPPTELVDALRRQDVRRLVAVPGVGKKTAERMVLELAEKVAQPRRRGARRRRPPPSPPTTSSPPSSTSDTARPRPSAPSTPSRAPERPRTSATSSRKRCAA